MNTKVATVLGITSIVVAILLLAVGPIVATHQAGACRHGGCGGGYVYGGNGFYNYGGSGFYYGNGG